MFTLHEPLVILPVTQLTITYFGKNYLEHISFFEKIGLSLIELSAALVITLLVDYVINHTFLAVLIGKKRKVKD